MYLLKKLILLFTKTYTAILKCLFVYVFIKEINYFIQQRCIKLIKSDSKDVNI